MATLLIDDDKHNVAVAKADGYHAILFDSARPLLLKHQINVLE
jgi:hypothetical protein